MVDIAEWLDGLGLGRYAPAFGENEIDWEILPKLTADEKEKVIEALKACPLWYVRTRMPYVYIANGVATVLK